MKYTFDEIMDFHPDNNRVYCEIVDNISKIVPFVGAGMTTFVYGTWNDLLYALTDRLTDSEEKKRIKNMIGKGGNNCFAAAELLEKKRSVLNFKHDLMYYFSEKKLAEKEIQLSEEAVWVLPELFQELVITTNFDQVLEYVYKKRSHEFKEVFGPGKNELLLTALREKNEGALFKLHGTIKDGFVDYSNIVLTESQYRRHYSDDAALTGSMKECFNDKLLLFLGCSLKQDLTMELLRKTLRPGIKNYTIINCSRNERDERVRQLGDLNIRAIVYEGERHEAVRIILEHLLEDLYCEQKKNYVKSVVIKGKQSLSVDSILDTDISKEIFQKKEITFADSMKSHPENLKSCGIESGKTAVSYPKKLTQAPALNPKAYKKSRSELEGKVLHHIEAGENVLLYGCGGIGKTSVAQEIYHIVSSCPTEKYGVNSLAWVTYGSDLAVSIYNSVSGPKGKNSTYFASEWLEKNPGMLLFIDNVDDESAFKSDQLFKSLGNYTIRVVVTGRIQENTFFETEEVPPLPLEACRELFYSYYEDCVRQDDILDQILTTLCCHTVTVELTAKIASAEGISLAELRQRLEENGLKFSDEAVGTITYSRLPDEKKLIEQLKIIFSISNCRDKEKRLLGQMAVIPQQSVTGKQIHEWFECQYSVIESVAGKGWISRGSRTNSPDRTYSMNRIVSQAILDQNSMEEVYASCSNFVGLLSDKLYVKKHGNDNTLEKYLALGRSVLQICHEQMRSKKDMQLLVNFLNAYTYIGAYQEIIDLQDIAKGIIRRFAADSVLSANLECILGVACQRVAEFRRAIEHYNNALNICRQCSDYKPSELYWAELVLKNNIATARHRFGSFQEADILYREVEDRCADFLSRRKDRRVETLLTDCMNNHGALLSEWGKESAAQYCLSALKKNLLLLADDKDDRTYINTNIYINLALCAADGKKKYIDHLIEENAGTKDSLALLDLAFRQRKHTENKLALATAEHDLGVFFYLMKNDLETALNYTRDALNIRKRYYGSTHPSTMSSRLNLGTFLLCGENSERTAEGIQMYRSMVSDLGKISDEECSNIRQIPRIIYSNMGLFPDKDIQREIQEAVLVYRENDIGEGVIKQLHETYGSSSCRSDVWNLIINREVSNITIANKL